MNWTTKNRDGLYNNDSQLFANARNSYRTRNIIPKLEGEFVRAGSDGLVARFESAESAKEAMLMAGYEVTDEGDCIPMRPWTAAEVPVGAWVQYSRYRGDKCFTSIIGVTWDSVIMAEHDPEDAWHSFEQMLTHSYSTDHGKTWRVCGKP